MKKKRRFFCDLLRGALAVCLCLGTVSLPAAAQEQTDANLFQNPGFEEGKAGWETWSNGDTAHLDWEQGAGVEGSGGFVLKNQRPDASAVFQFPGLEAGKTYRATAKVRYEEVSWEGNGVVLGVSMYDSQENNIGEMIGPSHYGSSEGWEEISFLFTVRGDAVRANCGVRLWFSTGTLYADALRVEEMAPPAAITESGEYHLSLSDTANPYPVTGMGCEWDPKLLLSCNTGRGVGEEHLALIEQRMRVLGIQQVRMMICPEWFEPQNDNDDPFSSDPEGFSFENEEMRCLFAYLDVCQRLGVEVNLTWWCAQTLDGRGWLSFPGVSDWASAPNDLEEMAENISYLLRYLCEEQEYTCVKGLILQNEPSYSFQTAEGKVDFDYYVEYYRKVKARLDQEGLSEKILLIGSDDAQNLPWFQRSYTALKDICGAFESHNYAWSYDAPALDLLVQDFVKERVEYAPDRPFFFGEFGDGSNQGAYSAGSVDTYGRGIYIASVAVNAFKAGATGLSYWPLHDVYYYMGNPDDGNNGGLMSMGLMGYPEDGQWRYRPTYYAWGLLCNYAPMGAQIYDITGENGSVIDAVALKSREGRWSIFCVNRSAASQAVQIQADGLGNQAMCSYLYSENTLPVDGNLPQPGEDVLPAQGAYTLSLPAYSMMVLTNLPEAYRYMPGPAVSQETPSDYSNTNDDGQASFSAETQEPKQPFGSAWLYGGIAAVGLVLAGLLAGGWVLKKRKKNRPTSGPYKKAP